MQLSDLGVSPQKEKQFANKGITNAEELLLFLPRKYKDYTKPGALTRIRLMNHRIVNGKKTFLAINGLLDDGQQICVTWFNQEYMWQDLCAYVGQYVWVPTDEIKWDEYREQYSITVPSVFCTAAKKPGIVPIYPKIPGMSAEYHLSKLEEARSLCTIEDTLPENLREGYCSYWEAICKLHWPKTEEDIQEGQMRLVYDDLIYFAGRQYVSKQTLSVGSTFGIRHKKKMNEIMKALPYILTKDQSETLTEMTQLVKEGKRLNALLQGDVGCGKSIVAFLMMIAFAENGYQTVIMAPTQVLAEQHYADLCALLPEEDIAFLSSGAKVSEKKKILKKIASGECRYIVGTHSVIGKSVEYKNLALTITDEEHKFGVLQRQALLEKASQGVHSITMSATPIPRTLAQVVYGDDIQLFTITTMPKGRVPVITGIAESRERIYRFLRSEVKKGHQAYVVCPMIDAKEDMASVEQTIDEYQKALAPNGVRISALTGRNKAEETRQILGDFKSGNIDVLISTTVVEVGVNVPNATVMVISSADRFGLSQIHQLRGRVGRGALQSYCVLDPSEKSSAKAMERMSVLCRTANGFEVAEADLKLRGAGDLIGTKQSGDNHLVSLMLAYPEIYKEAKEIAYAILDEGIECGLAERVMENEDVR